MIGNRKILAFIPARGGSKGIKDKNIHPLCGKPLISYTIECAKKSKFIDEVLVSTDSPTIASVSRKYGASVPFLRPAELAKDTSKSIDAVLHAITELKNKGKNFDILVLLQPTSPLRAIRDVDNALKTFIKNNEQPLASVSEVNDNPILIRTIDSKGVLKNLLNANSTIRRQDMTKYYRINGSIYINRISDINKDTSFNDNPIPYIIPSNRSVDIDEMKDLIIAEYYITASKNT